MRYLRLLPLLVIVFATPAAADDHQMDLFFGPSFASGSYLLGGRVAVAAPVPMGTKKYTDGHIKKPFSGVFDIAIESGTTSAGYEKRQTYVGGLRYTLPQSGPHHKVHVQGLGGWSNVKNSDDGGGAGVLGIGWEFVPEPGEHRSRGLGLGAQLDFVVAQESQVRFSVGLVYRFNKD